MINSQKKGAQYERDIANTFSSLFGEKFRRYGAQEKWKSYSGDIRPEKTGSWFSRFHFELKKHENWSILAWYKKAVDDADELKTPLIICSKNNEQDYVFLSLKDFARILNNLKGYEANEKDS